jgi:hypothetical protein
MTTPQVVEARHRKPQGWRSCGPNESEACPHRDLSVCPECATRYADRIVDVYSSVYWYEYDSDRAAMLAEIASYA